MSNPVSPEGLTGFQTDIYIPIDAVKLKNLAFTKEHTEKAVKDCFEHVDPAYALYIVPLNIIAEQIEDQKTAQVPLDETSKWLYDFYKDDWIVPDALSHTCASDCFKRMDFYQNNPEKSDCDNIFECLKTSENSYIRERTYEASCDHRTMDETWQKNTAFNAVHLTYAFLLHAFTSMDADISQPMISVPTGEDIMNTKRTYQNWCKTEELKKAFYQNADDTYNKYDKIRSGFEAMLRIRADKIAKALKITNADPCPCGNGKLYGECHGDICTKL